MHIRHPCQTPELTRARKALSATRGLARGGLGTRQKKSELQAKKSERQPQNSGLEPGVSLRLAIPPACYRSLSGPSGPKCSRSVRGSVPETGGCPRECPTGCPRGPLGPGLRSVQKVSRECPRSVRTEGPERLL